MQFPGGVFNEMSPNLHVINLWEKNKTKQQIHYTPPGAEAPQVGLQRVKNAICVGQCLSLNLFQATNYTMQGCESV